MHYYSFNIADYRKDTHHLEPLEHYIYRSLMDSYYLDEKPIPKKTQSVIRRLRLGSDQLSLLENVLNDFFILVGDEWHHKRIDSEIEDYQSKCNKNKVNGKKGGRPKKQPLSESDKPKKTQSVNLDNPSESELNPNQEPRTKNHKPITNNQEKESSVDSKPTAGFNFKNSLIDLGIDKQVVDDWLIVRKNKKASNTKTAFNKIKNEIDKSNLSANEAAIFAVEKSWAGFDTSWLSGEQNQKPSVKKLGDAELVSLAGELSIQTSGLDRWGLINAIEAKQNG